MKKTLEYLGQSANEVDVFYDPVFSHAATHFEDTPLLKDIFIETIQTIALDGSSIAEDIDVGRVIGTSDVVEVYASDSIIYAQRKNRIADGLVPFVKNRRAENCSRLAFHLEPIDRTSYELKSVWIGTFDNVPFPGEKDAGRESLLYWQKHAFIYGSQEITAATETAICPW